MGKPRLQIDPGTWTAEGGGERLGASLTSSVVKPPPASAAGEPLVAPAGWA
jgi:hypothetical protein